MLNLINIPLVSDLISEYGDLRGLKEYCRKNGIDGIEGIWGYEDLDYLNEKELIHGWHLIFFCDWLDFWKQDERALAKKFGSREIRGAFYMGKNRNDFIKLFADDLERAERAGVKYVVFHVSDVSIEECYTYDWLHSDEEVIDNAVEMINLLLDGKDYDFDFLVENLNWPGFSMTKPDMTKRLMDGINYRKKGIMLDTGHLMCSDKEICSQDEGIEYILENLEKHGDLCKYIKGIHLHQSVSGRYVKENTGFLPELPKDYFERFELCYKHILKIDTHRPFSTGRAAEIINFIKPEYVVHELSAQGKEEKHTAVMTQMAALGMKKEKKCFTE